MRRQTKDILYVILITSHCLLCGPTKHIIPVIIISTFHWQLRSQTKDILNVIIITLRSQWRGSFLYLFVVVDCKLCTLMLSLSLQINVVNLFVGLHSVVRLPSSWCSWLTLQYTAVTKACSSYWTLFVCMHWIVDIQRHAVFRQNTRCVVAFNNFYFSSFVLLSRSLTCVACFLLSTPLSYLASWCAAFHSVIEFLIINNVFDLIQASPLTVGSKYRCPILQPKWNQ